jgi:uncharacterized Zn-binding protein involved in type VI secretion
MADAAREGDDFDCALSDGTNPHQGGKIQKGVSSVLIGGKPAATVGSICLCKSPAPNMIAKGEFGVLIDSLPAARRGDLTTHGGTITTGESGVQIG